MKRYLIVISLLLCTLPLVSSHSKQGEEDAAVYKVLPYIGEFSSDEEGLKFQLSGYMLSASCVPTTDGVIQTPFHISKGGRELGTADLDCMKYDGPGYRAYMFGRAIDKYQAIVIEALADNGTAWYWVVLSDGKRIVSQRLLDEPRANSDICELKDVMQISVSDVDCKIRMELKHIARYSTIPKYLKTDSRWVYITMPIGKNQPDSPRLFEYSNDTIRQSVEVSLLDDSRISFKLTTENKLRKKTAVMQGVATNKQKDFGASETDEDETGSLYPVVEYTYKGDCWLAFRFDEKYGRLRIKEADNEKPVPGCPLKSVGVLTVKMQHLKFIPEEFNNIEVGFSKTGITLCSPGYPNDDIPLNTLLINAPEKIVYTMQSGRAAVMIPICIADNISLRRLHKYHKDYLTFHVKVINEEKVYSGKVYDEENAGDRIPIPSIVREKMMKDRDRNDKEAQKYSDDELDEGTSYPSFMNLNVLDYVQMPFQPGHYEIWYTFRGLESNHCYFDIIESSIIA